METPWEPGVRTPGALTTLTLWNTPHGVRARLEVFGAGMEARKACDLLFHALEAWQQVSGPPSAGPGPDSAVVWRLSVSPDDPRNPQVGWGDLDAPEGYQPLAIEEFRRLAAGFLRG